MTKFFWKYFGLNRLKGLLDKLPANGRKTIIGFLVMALAVAASIFPEYADMLRSTAQFLSTEFETAPVLTSGAVIAFVGLLHKLLKILEIIVEYLQKKEEEENGDTE